MQAMMEGGEAVDLQDMADATSFPPDDLLTLQAAEMLTHQVESEENSAHALICPSCGHEFQL